VVTGDPSNTGNGGTTFEHLLDSSKPETLPDEIAPDTLKHNVKGLIATANPGPNLNNSQFYITLVDNELPYLDNKHTIFGKVIEGLDVIDEMNKAFCDKDGKPLKPIYIKHTHVMDDPFADPSGLVVPDSPTTVPEELAFELELGKESKKKTDEEIKKEKEEHEAKKRATVLWMVDDLPDVDVKPPENVLFVCKLNPVTQEEDLELIFSRFGLITSCNIVRDKQTGDSLQYAFIEYNSKEDCENAYFQMQNALIDGRRVHVDFSQSVVKQWVGFRKKQMEEVTKKIVTEELKNTEKPKDNYRKERKHKRSRSRDRHHRSRSHDRKRHKH
jgi:peptidyl-prolyl cis-trans isomerase-like 4